METNQKIQGGTPMSFLYHCLKQNSIIDIYTTQTSIAEELSLQGCTVTCKKIIPEIRVINFDDKKKEVKNP